MEEYPWLDELNRMEKTDPWRTECMTRAKELEAAYEEACAGLTPAQRQTVEDYIAACEDAQRASVFLAWELGRRWALAEALAAL